MPSTQSSVDTRKSRNISNDFEKNRKSEITVEKNDSTISAVIYFHCDEIPMDPKESFEILKVSSTSYQMVEQKTITLPPFPRGCHLITHFIESSLPPFSQGLCHIFLRHTSASLALNESWDPDVRSDMETILNALVPESNSYTHSCEGPDDMPAHAKSVIIGSSLTIPITDGKLALGTWQGIWLCEHRDSASNRSVTITALN